MLLVIMSLKNYAEDVVNDTYQLRHLWPHNWILIISNMGYLFFTYMYIFLDHYLRDY